MSYALWKSSLSTIRRAPFETSLNDIRSMEEIGGNPAALDKPSLIIVDEVIDQGLGPNR